MDEGKYLHIARVAHEGNVTEGYAAPKQLDIEVTIPDGYVILIEGVEVCPVIETGVSGEVLVVAVSLDPEEATLDWDDDSMLMITNVHHEIATYGGFKNPVVDRLWLNKPIPYAHNTIRVLTAVTAGTWTVRLSVAVYFRFAKATAEEWIAIRRRG